MKNFTSLMMLVFCSFGFIASTSDIESSGAPAGSTGAPNELTCGAAACHDTNAINSGTAMAELLNDFEAGQYTPGETYDLSVHVTDDMIDRFGFQLVALNSEGNNAGEMIVVDEERTQLLMEEENWGDRQYLTYTFHGTKATVHGESTWDLSWRAPDTDQGPVTFYLAAVSADNDYTDEGDYVVTNATTVTSPSTSIKEDLLESVRIFPNPIVSDFAVQISMFEAEDAEVAIHDMNGRLVQKIYGGELTKGLQTVKGRVSRKLSAGLYVINIRAGEQEYKETVIIK